MLIYVSHCFSKNSYWFMSNMLGEHSKNKGIPRAYNTTGSIAAAEDKDPYIRMSYV